MTVFELAIYIAIHRSKQPVATEVVSRMLEGWFEQLVEPGAVSAATTGMVRRGWLLPLGDGFRATEPGRQVTRSLINGVIRMLDQGTRLIDVALMMSVLRLTKGETNNAHV
jgi:hypothetical protein